MTDNAQFLDPTQILKDLNLEEGMIIADFGAGSGYMSFKAAEMVGKHGLVYALDVKKAVIEHLKNEIRRQGLDNVKSVWTNLEMVNYNPIKPGKVDIVMVVNMLFQSHKYADILAEAKRELKPGGKILVVDWKKTGAPLGPPVEERVDLEKIKQSAYTLELNKIREFEASPYHFGIVFKK